MPKLEDEEDASWAYKRVPGRFYVSNHFPAGGAGAEEEVVGRPCRFAYHVLGDVDEGVVFFGDGGWEIVLRETEKERQQLKALFFEDDRQVTNLVFQRFKYDGRPMRIASVILRGDEIEALRTFLGVIDRVGIEPGDQRFKISADMAKDMVVDTAALASFARANPAVLAAVVENEVTAPEVVAIARRKRVLEEFERLLGDEDYFHERCEDVGGPENVWQRLFEENTWLMGSTIAPQFLHTFDSERLQQTVVGASVRGAGKRPDGLLTTAGAISSLVLAEIKAHRTPLLRAKTYRSGCWAIGEDVAGGVAQCQATAHRVEREFGDVLRQIDGDGFERGQIHVCRPRTVLVVGSLDQFKSGHAVHHERFESFERFRRGVRDPEIITFDELYERARMSILLAEDAQAGRVES